MLEGVFSLANRTAVVTGGSRGIGRMIAAGFIEAGAKVYITARDASACAKTADELGPSCIALPRDLSNLAGVRAFAAELAEREPAIHILVNNAGAAWGAKFTEFPENGWDKVMDLNLKSPFFLTQALYPLLKAAASDRQPAKVINIASIDGMTLCPEETYSYHASKAALIHLTRRMAQRLAADRIAVTAIAPGAFVSKMNYAAREHADKLADMTPMGRIGDDIDMAACAVFLASRAGDYIVGATIPVDGGVALASLGRPEPDFL